MKNFWHDIKSVLKKQLPSHTYWMWIEPVEFVSFENSVVKLSCPNGFLANRVKKNYVPDMRNALSQIGLDGVEIELTVDTEKRGAKDEACRKACLEKNSRPGAASPAAFPLKGKGAKARQLMLPGSNFRFNSGRIMKKGYTFDDFVVGDSNNFAYQASLSVAKGIFHNECLLYLLSGTGLGKSHLAQATGHYIITNNISQTVYYVTAEDFTNEMIASLRSNTIDQFKSRYRKNCEVLILEDVHFLSGKKAIQKELAITLDYLVDSGKKIILSGSYLPGDIPKIDEALQSRISSGIVSKIDAPDFNTRIKILKRKSKVNGYDMPNEVIEFLAQELCDNVRLLESGLNGVAAKSSILGERVDLNLAKSVLSTFSKRVNRISVENIKHLICREFSITEKELLSPSRKKSVVRPRQMGIYLSRKYTDQPLKTIGKSFNRYHATAIYAISAVERELKKNGVMAEQVKYLKSKIESGKL